MLESYSVALNIKEVRWSSQVLFFRFTPKIGSLPYTFQYYYAHFILFLFTFSFFLFLGQHSVWTVLLWSLFCLRSVPVLFQENLLVNIQQLGQISPYCLHSDFWWQNRLFHFEAMQTICTNWTKPWCRFRKCFPTLPERLSILIKYKTVDTSVENKQHYENLFRCFD